jgi:endonuclease YncB( thermonuclease family)
MNRLALLFALLLALPAAAQTVTDGDTLRFGKERVRLWGIDAPEIHQRCEDRWLAGIEAARKMRELVKGHEVTCENRGHDRYGRMIGLCRADGVDIQAAMVRSGMAWAFVRYSSDYVREEEQAKVDRLGVHAHGCEQAWEWRGRHSE